MSKDTCLFLLVLHFDPKSVFKYKGWIDSHNGPSQVKWKRKRVSNVREEWERRLILTSGDTAVPWPMSRMWWLLIPQNLNFWLDSVFSLICNPFEFIQWIYTMIWWFESSSNYWCSAPSLANESPMVWSDSLISITRNIIVRRRLTWGLILEKKEYINATC